MTAELYPTIRPKRRRAVKKTKTTARAPQAEETRLTAKVPACAGRVERSRKRGNPVGWGDPAGVDCGQQFPVVAEVQRRHRMGREPAEGNQEKGADVDHGDICTTSQAGSPRG